MNPIQNYRKAQWGIRMSTPENPTDGTATPPTTRRPRVRLSTLLLIVTVAACLLAWWLDHQRLASQINTAEPIIIVYRLQYLEAEDVSKIIQDAYKDQMLGVDANSNSLIVTATPDVHQKLELQLRTLDQVASTRVDVVDDE